MFYYNINIRFPILKVVKIKVLYVIGSLNVGGTELHLVRLLPKLKTKGYEPIVCCLTANIELAPTLIKKNIRVFCPPFPSFYQAFPATYRKIYLIIISPFYILFLYLFLSPSVVHFFLPHAYVMGGIISLPFFWIKKVMSRRSLNFYQKKHRFISKLELILHKYMDCITGNSKVVIGQLVEEGVDISKIKLIYNGVVAENDNANKSNKEFHPKIGLQTDSKVLNFLCVANLIEYKGHADLLNALSSIKERLPQKWKLTCIGEDRGILGDLIALSEQLGISKNITWAGKLLDKHEYFLQADIGVLCSHEEGFSNFILECMISGIPMVVTNVGGNKEAIIHGKNGFVVESKNPKDIANNILKLACDSSIRNAFGKQGLLYASNNFSMECCVENYKDLYQGLFVGKCNK